MVFYTLTFYWFLFFTNLFHNNLANSYIEIDIYNSIYEKTKNINYTYEILDETDQIYKNSNLNITFYVKEEVFFQNDKNDINDLLYYRNNTSDITLILVNIPTLKNIRGLSYVNTICSENAIMIANIYNVPSTLISYIIAHELGHVFGAHHDESVDNIMNSNIVEKKNYLFTENSKNEMRLQESCLLYKPEKYTYMSREKLLVSSNQRNSNFYILYITVVIVIIILC